MLGAPARGRSADRDRRSRRRPRRTRAPTTRASTRRCWRSPGAMLDASARARSHGAGRHDGPLADVGASVLGWLTGEQPGGLPGELVHKLRRCPSCPRSRRSGASSRRWWRAGGCERIEILDPRWSRPLAPAGARATRSRAGASSARAARQVPAVELRGRRAPRPAPAHDRRGAGRSRPRAGAHAGADRARAAARGERKRQAPGDRRPAPLRHRRAAARLSRRSRRSSPRGSAWSRSTRASPPSTCASSCEGRTAPIKALLLDQRRIAGVGNIYADEALFRAGIHPLRPAGTLTLAQYERLRETVIEALQRRDRRARGDDRRLPPRRRGAGLLPGPVPRAPARGRAVRALREHDREDGRGGARDLRVRELPAAAAPRGVRRRASSSRRPSLVGGLHLGEAAEQLAVDEHLGEGHHARPLGQLERARRGPWRG